MVVCHVPRDISAHIGGKMNWKVLVFKWECKVLIKLIVAAAGTAWQLSEGTVCSVTSG